MRRKYSPKFEDFDAGCLRPIRFLRRKCHDYPTDLLEKKIRHIKRIINSPDGITIECYVEGTSYLRRFEHVDIWVAENAKEKIKQYFDTLPERTVKRLRFGRLRGLITYVGAVGSVTGRKAQRSSFSRKNEIDVQKDTNVYIKPGHVQPEVFADCHSPVKPSCAN